MTSQTFGAAAGPALTGDLRFVNPAAGDDHLGAGSTTRNPGALTSVGSDFAAEPRPPRRFVDLGFDQGVRVGRLLPQRSGC